MFVTFDDLSTDITRKGTAIGASHFVALERISWTRASGTRELRLTPASLMNAIDIEIQK